MVSLSDRYLGARYHYFFTSGKPMLTKKNLSQAKRMLFTVTGMLEEQGIPYHLEGGTLLGIVRDKELLPWDHDVDISVPLEFADKVVGLKGLLFKKGYKFSVRRSDIELGPIKKNQYRIVKVKPMWNYIQAWFAPKKKDTLVTLDVFFKVHDSTHAYWQAKGKVMRVDNRYYQSFETVPYDDRILRVPNFYQDYLTEKYGNWSIPVKEWDCSLHEGTILNETSSAS